MRYLGVVGVFIFCVFIVGLSCAANDITLLKTRVKLLETRLNVQVSIRDEEFEEITERLDDIDQALNFTIARGQPVISETREISKVDYTTVDLLKEDFARIRKAFREEKTETERIRREIPKIENNFTSINEYVESYCKGAFNNTYQLLKSVEASSASEKQMKETLETVKNSSEDNILAHKQERLILEDIGKNVQLQTENEQKMFAKISNLERIVTNLFSKIESLSLYGSSCLHLKNMGKKFSGLYKLHHGLDVYCDQTTDGGGWTVFQRRLNGQIDFYRSWTEYKNGFGDLSGEFWLGNDHLSVLTADGHHELRIETEDFDGNKAHAKYSKFKIYPEDEKFKLEVSGYSGTAGDTLTSHHNKMMFSTFDNDNDKSSGNCADRYHGAWWYNACYNSNLNGQYYNEPGKKEWSGIVWYDWKDSNYCLKSVQMKFR